MLPDTCYLRVYLRDFTWDSLPDTFYLRVYLREFTWDSLPGRVYLTTLHGDYYLRHVFVFKTTPQVHPPGIFKKQKFPSLRPCVFARKKIFLRSSLPKTLMNKKKKHTSGRASRGVSTGGAATCCHCRKLCDYGHKCKGCGKVFHNLCMLSMLEGTKKMCIKCFEKKKLPATNLDSHDWAPYSPSCKVPYDPFTKRYAVSKELLPKEVSVRFHVLFCPKLPNPR